MNICPHGILINQFQIHSLCGANLFVFLYVFVFLTYVFIQQSVCPLVSNVCQPNEKVCRNVILRIAVPLQRNHPERILLQMAPVLHIWFRSWKQNPMEIFVETFISVVSFSRRRGVKWNIGHRFEMGKAFPHFWHRMHFHQNSRVTVDYEAC